MSFIRIGYFTERYEHRKSSDVSHPWPLIYCERSYTLLSFFPCRDEWKARSSPDLSNGKMTIVCSMYTVTTPMWTSLGTDTGSSLRCSGTTVEGPFLWRPFNHKGGKFKGACEVLTCRHIGSRSRFKEFERLRVKMKDHTTFLVYCLTTTVYH